MPHALPSRTGGRGGRRGEAAPDALWEGTQIVATTMVYHAAVTGTIAAVLSGAKTSGWEGVVLVSRMGHENHSGFATV